MKLETINNHTVKAIPLPKRDTRPVKGADICKKAYGTIFNVAKRESGKTSVTFHFLQHCITKETNVIIFCSSLHNDESWVEIRRWLKKKRINLEVHTSIFDDNGVNQIEALVKQLSDEAAERENEGDEEVDQTEAICRYFDKHYKCREESEPKEKKEKYLAPKYLIIFDDISAELKSPSVVKLLKESRHYLARVIINSQYLNDLKPESRKMIDLWLIFKGQPEEKLEVIWKDADCPIPFPAWMGAYKFATTPTKQDQYPFFYADVRSNPAEFRRNFNRKIVIDNIREPKTRSSHMLSHNQE